MKVAHVVPVFPPYHGGMGRLAFEQARELAEKGVEVRVLTPATSVPPTVPRGVEVIPLRPALQNGNAAVLPQIVRWTRPCDLIHLHYPFFGTAELLAARRLLKGPPLVLQYQMDVVGEGWKAHLFHWHRRLALPLVLRAADAIIVTSADY